MPVRGIPADEGSVEGLLWVSGGLGASVGLECSAGQDEARGDDATGGHDLADGGGANCLLLHGGSEELQQVASVGAVGGSREGDALGAGGMKTARHMGSLLGSDPLPPVKQDDCSARRRWPVPEPPNDRGV